MVNFVKHVSVLTTIQFAPCCDKLILMTYLNRDQNNKIVLKLIYLLK